MGADIILTSITKNELEEIITNSIKRFVSISPNLEEAEDQIMNQKQAAQYLGVSQSTLISWKRKKKVPYEQIQGSSKIRFYKSQLKLVLMQNPGLLQAARK